MDRGARLIADDRTEISVAAGRLEVSAPREIKGLVEVRGIGLMPVESRDRAWLALVVDLVPADRVERLPGPAGWQCQGLAEGLAEGLAVPRLSLAPFEASTAAKVRLAVRGVKDGIITSS
jgi:hypothetical protein